MLYPHSCWRAISHAPGVVTLLIVLTIASGAYSFDDPRRTYLPAPSQANDTFAPATHSFTGLNSDRTLRGSAAVQATYSIDGQVMIGTCALSGVMMTLTAP